MRQNAAGLIPRHLRTASLALLLTAAGCHWLPWNKQDDPVRPGVTARPTVRGLVHELNDNARRVETIRAEIDLTARADGQSAPNVSGHMVCQKPRNFRLKAQVLGKPAVDLGSNDKEFWYWISRADPPYVFHCDYADLARGVRVPFPFDPELLVTALGMKEFDADRPEEKYVLKEQGKYLQLFEPTRGNRGEQLFRVTVFDGSKRAGGKHRVVAHMVVDEKGKPISKATIQEVKATPGGAVVPTRLTLVWPAEKVELKLALYDPTLKPVSPEQAVKLFRWEDLTREGGLRDYDLASGTSLMRGTHRQATFLTPRD